MPKKILGRAQYRAIRSGGITYLIAVGETPNYTDKTDFEMLPFLINPPMFAFYFIQQDVSLPATRPFTYEEAISHPASAGTVRIQDADGMHEITIKEMPLATGAVTLADTKENGYCVYSWIGTDKLMIAKCDAILPAVYTRVFGPATHARCEAYVKENSTMALLNTFTDQTTRITELETLQRTKRMLRREWLLADEPLSDTDLRKQPPAGLGKNDKQIRALETPIEAVDFADVEAQVTAGNLAKAKIVADLSDKIWNGIPAARRA